MKRPPAACRCATKTKSRDRAGRQAGREDRGRALVLARQPASRSIQPALNFPSIAAHGAARHHVTS